MIEKKQHLYIKYFNIYIKDQYKQIDIFKSFFFFLIIKIFFLFEMLSFNVIMITIQFFFYCYIFQPFSNFLLIEFFNKTIGKYNCYK